MTVVALHGFTGRASDWAAVDGARGVALAGHGGGPPRDFGAEVARLAAIVGALPGPVHLVGYSMGGRLALAVALAGPPSLARLTVIGAHPGLASASARDQRRARDRRWIDLLARGIGPFVDAWEAQPMWRSRAALDPAVRAAQRAARLAHDPGALAAALAALGLAAQPDLGPALPDLDLPVTFVAGALDRKFVALARAAARRVPRGRAVLVDGAGHNPLLERPAAIAALIHGDPP